jgi:hypothetical protein
MHQALRDGEQDQRLVAREREKAGNQHIGIDDRPDHFTSPGVTGSGLRRFAAISASMSAGVRVSTLRPIMTANVDRASYLMTDESPVYWSIGRQFAGHGAVNHSAEEYVRAFFWHTNTAENYFSILKRGIYGCYFHVSEDHLHRYTAEFRFSIQQSDRARG